MFSMPIDDVFYIKGRGVVATGTIAEGSLRVGDQVWIGDRATVVDGIESFRKRRDEVFGEACRLVGDEAERRL